MNGDSDVIGDTNGYPRRLLSRNGDTTQVDQRHSPRSPTSLSYRTSNSMDAEITSTAGTGTLTSSGGTGAMTSTSAVADEFTKCFLCDEMYIAPKMLPCMHTFCLQCLQLYVKRDRHLQRKSDESERRVYKENRTKKEIDKASDDLHSKPLHELVCPRCYSIIPVPENGLNALPDHIFYGRLADIRRLSSVQQDVVEIARVQSETLGPDVVPGSCSICSQDHENNFTPTETAAFMCLDCNEQMCADCARAHRKQTLSKSHKVTSLTTQGAPLTDRQLSTTGGLQDLIIGQLSVCTQHPNEKVSLYCSDCSMPLCYNCHEAGHAGHHIADVTDVAIKGRITVTQGVHRLAQRIEAFRKRQGMMTQQKGMFLQQVEDASRQISENAKEMRAQIDACQAQLLAETQAIRDNTLQQLEKISEDIEMGLQNTESLHELSEQLLEKGTDSDVALLSARLLGRIKQLEAANNDVAICSLKFRPNPSSTTNLLGKVALLDIDSSDPYIDNPSIIDVIPGSQSVAGVTVLEDELYIVRDITPFVDVYSSVSFVPIRRLRLDGLRKPADIASSLFNHGLYVSDSTGYVYSLQPQGQILFRWQVEGEPHGLFVYTGSGHVLVTCYDTRMFKEYTSDGAYVRSIRYQQDVASPSQTIAIDSERYVVCHGWESGKLHRVCYIDAAGRTTRTYGGANGSGPGRMDSPVCMAVDPFGYIFVLDRNNDRIQLLSQNLVYVRDLIGRNQYGTKQPRRMCLDASGGCLYVGLIDGRVIAFRILNS